MTNRAHNHPSSTLIYGSMKVADLVDLNYKLLGVLTRLGTRLGFGESTVSELCRRYDVDEYTFLQVCKVYTFKDYRPCTEDLDRICSADLLKYLKMSHLEYTRTSLNVLDGYLGRILAGGDKRAGQIIGSFFSDYKNELKKHFEYEEQSVFPYVQALAAGRKPEGFDTIIDDDHTDIGEKIDDLKNIVMKYLPATGQNEVALPTLSYLYMVRDDLLRHTAVEDNILVPLIKRMEENR